MKRPDWVGIVLIFLSAIGFSIKAILVKLAYFDPVDTITLLTLRMIFSLPFFILAAVWSQHSTSTEKLSNQQWLIIIGLGLVGYYLASYLDFLGLNYISAAFERLTLYIYPTFVLLISAYFLKKTITRHHVIALVLSYLGIALIFVSDVHFNQSYSNTLLGATFVLGSALAYAIYLVGSEKVVHQIGALRFTAYAMIVSSIACMVQFLLTHHYSAMLGLTSRVYYLSIAMAIFSTVLPVYMMAEGIRRIGASRASLISSAGPVITIFFGFIFLNEPISFIQIAGTILILAGIINLIKSNT